LWSSTACASSSRLDAPPAQEMLLGTWTIQAQREGKLLAEKSFSVEPK
jgi:hypothetical protein